VLGAEGVTAVAGPNPPQALTDEMHAAWVRFIAIGDPGWSTWTGHDAYVFAADQTDRYEISRPPRRGLVDSLIHSDLVTTWR